MAHYWTTALVPVYKQEERLKKSVPVSLVYSTDTCIHTFMVLVFKVLFNLVFKVLCMSLEMCKKERITSTRKCWGSRYKQEAKKTDFHWRKGACQTPHCCYKSTPVLTSCVDNIPTVCAPSLCFLCSSSWLASNQSTALFLLAVFTFLSL